MLAESFASAKPTGACLRFGTMARTRSVNRAPALITCVLFICASAQANMMDLCKEGHTTPLGDIKLEYGQVPLVITCTITSAAKIAANSNISSSMFYTTAGLEVQNKTRILNSTSIQLYDEHPLKSNQMYTCKLRGSGKEKDEHICWNDVSIGVKPYHVQDFKCISNNYENLTCSWTPVNTVVDTRYDLTFHYGNKSPIIKCPQLDYPGEYEPVSSKIRCVLDLGTDPQYRLVLPIYFFMLHMSNELGNYTNPTYEFHHFKNVKSGPPERLEAVNTTTSSIYLNWSIPNAMVTFPKALQFRVVYQCEYGPKKWLPGGENNGTMTLQKHNSAAIYYNLTGLTYAHALCDIRVAIRSAEARDDDTMWSANASITVRTSTNIPGAPPNTTIGSFEISFSEIETVTDITRNEVYIYWQQIDDSIKNGEEFRYETIPLVNYPQTQGQHAPLALKEQSNAYAKYSNLVLSNTYTFAVYSVNSQGRSVKSSEIVVPAQTLRPKEPGSFTKVSFGEGVYELQWEPAAHDRGAPALTGYTLFWCSNDRDRPYQCTGHLDWINLPANETSHHLTVVENKQVTQFAIAANTGPYSSGLLWASCTILHDKYVGKIRDFWINNVGATHIEVGWKLACSERIGNVAGYKIYYCPIISPKETDCKGDLQTQSIEGDENLIHGSITGLTPYVTYMLRISVVAATTPNANKTSQMSDALYNTTLEAAPSAPLNLTVLNVTNASITLTWNSPTFSNGVLKYYKINYNDRTKEIEPSPEKSNKTSELVYLQSYVTYNITVQACTTFCSEPSEMLEVRTNMGSPGIIATIDRRFQNDTYVLVSWPKPSPPRGKLDYYQLKIKREIGYKNESLPVSIATEPKYAVTHCGDNNRYNTFYMSVRGVNVVDDVVVPGPWSDEIKFFCKAPSSSIFWVVFSTVMAVAFGLLLWLSRRCYYHYRDMRNVEVKLPPGLATNALGDATLPYWSDSNNHTSKSLNANLTLGLNLTGMNGSQTHSYPHNIYSGTKQDSQQLQQQHQVKSDEELVLLKMTRHESDRMSSGDSSGCSTGHDSASSSIEGSAQLDDIDIDVGDDDEAVDIRLNGDRCSSDSGTDQANSNSTTSLDKTSSLRLRKPAPEMPSSGGYITVPPDLSSAAISMVPSINAAPPTGNAPLWSIVTAPNQGTYCMMGIDPGAANAADFTAGNNNVQANVQPTVVGTIASAYVSFDSQHKQPQINRGMAAGAPQAALPRSPAVSLQQGIKNAVSNVSGCGYIPLMYGDPSDTENDLAITPPPNLSQPPNYVLASIANKQIGNPKLASLLLKPQQHDHQLEKPLQVVAPYVQAAKLSNHLPNIASAVVVDHQPIVAIANAPGYVSVADVASAKPQLSNLAGYLPHRPLNNMNE